MTTVPLRCSSPVFLYIQNGLLSKEDQKLPLAWHVIRSLEHVYLVEYFISRMFMWSQEVIVSHPESQVIVGTVDVIKSVRAAVRSLVRAVQPFNHLFERAVFFRNSIVVGKSKNLGNGEGKVFTKLFCEFHCSKRICTVTVRNKFKVFREFCKPMESHTHGEDAGTNPTVIGYLIAENGTCGGVHDQPDVSFDAADLDIGFISSEDIPFLVRILVDKGLDTDGSGFAVVSDLLVGNADVLQVF